MLQAQGKLEQLGLPARLARLDLLGLPAQRVRLEERELLAALELLARAALQGHRAMKGLLDLMVSRERLGLRVLLARQDPRGQLDLQEPPALPEQPVRLVLLARRGPLDPLAQPVRLESRAQA